MSCKSGTTHHSACDCREAEFAQLRAERDELKAECERLREHNRELQRSIDAVDGINVKLTDENVRLREEIEALTHDGRQGELEQANVGLANEVERLRTWQHTAAAAMREKDAEAAALRAEMSSLRSEIESAPWVVCRKDDGRWACDEHAGFARATHRAKLVRIEPIVKEKPCFCGQQNNAGEKQYCPQHECCEGCLNFMTRKP